MQVKYRVKQLTSIRLYILDTIGRVLRYKKVGDKLQHFNRHIGCGIRQKKEKKRKKEHTSTLSHFLLHTVKHRRAVCVCVCVSVCVSEITDTL